MSKLLYFFLFKPYFSLLHHNVIMRKYLTTLEMKKEVKFTPNLYKPKTNNQLIYANYLNDNKIKLLYVVGPAGTGKTLLAVNKAIEELQKQKIYKIIITRPVIPVEEDIGFLPGNINKKMDPWMRPILDIFLEFYSQREIDIMMQTNIIEISPLAYMRGRTFKNAFIIADEMQNSSPNQMLMLTTRIGEKSKMIITGDLKQSDKTIINGLSDFLQKYKKFDNILHKYTNKTSDYSNSLVKIIEMDKTDIERSETVKQILDIYNVDEIARDIYNHDLSITMDSYNIIDDCAIIPKNYPKKDKNSFF